MRLRFLFALPVAAALLGGCESPSTPSPPAEALLYWAFTNPPIRHLFFGLSDGSTPLSYGGWRCTSPASWSPDGSEIAVSFSGEPRCSGPGVVIIDTGTGETRPVTTAPPHDAGYWAYERGPDWSPDGSQIVFARWYAEAGQQPPEAGVFVIAPDGTGERRVASGMYFAPRWSPDGARIVLAGRTHDNSGSQNYGIWLVHADEEGIHRVTDPPAGADDHSPEWMTDGRIRFRRLNRYYAVLPDGSGLTELTDPREYGTLSPDGNWLLWVTRKSGVLDQIMVAAADGSDARSIADGWLPRWRPR